MGFFGSIINIGRGALGVVTGGTSERILGIVPGVGGASTGKDVVQPNRVNPVLRYVEARGVPGYSRLTGEGAKKSAFSRAFKAGRFRSDRWLTSLGSDGKLNGELKAFTAIAEIQGGFKGNLGGFPGVTVAPSQPPSRRHPTTVIGENITQPAPVTYIPPFVPAAGRPAPAFDLAGFLATLLKDRTQAEGQTVKPSPPGINPLFIFGGGAIGLILVGTLVFVVAKR